MSLDILSYNGWTYRHDLLFKTFHQQRSRFTAQSSVDFSVNLLDDEWKFYCRLLFFFTFHKVLTILSFYHILLNYPAFIINCWLLSWWHFSVYSTDFILFFNFMIFNVKLYVSGQLYTFAVINFILFLK